MGIASLAKDYMMLFRVKILKIIGKTQTLCLLGVKNVKLEVAVDGI